MSRQDAPLFVAPSPAGHALYRVDGGAVVRLVTVSRAADAIVSLSDDGRFVAVLDQAGKRGSVWGIAEAGTKLARHVAPRTLPRACTGHAVASHHGVLYVGGAGPRGESLWVATPDSPQGWRNAAPRPDVSVPSKAIDALLLDGDRLVAVDDIVLPKFSFVFDVSAPGEPRLVDQVDLPVHMTYERVCGAVIGGRFIAVRSHGAGGMGSTAHIALLDRATLAELATWNGHEPWSAPKRRRAPSGDDQPGDDGGDAPAEDEGDELGAGPAAEHESVALRACDLLVTDDVLVVATGEDAISCADLSAIPYFPRPGGAARSFRLSGAPAGPDFRRVAIPGLAGIRHLAPVIGTDERIAVTGTDRAPRVVTIAGAKG